MTKVTVELSAQDRRLLRRIAEALEVPAAVVRDFPADLIEHTNDGSGYCAKCEVGEPTPNSTMNRTQWSDH
jgi:hypothetical protein